MEELVEQNRGYLSWYGTVSCTKQIVSQLEKGFYNTRYPYWGLKIRWEQLLAY